MTSDSFLPFAAYPASESESYVVRGHGVGHFVEISLSRDRRKTRLFGSDIYEPIELLEFKRFPQREVGAYSAYAGNLESAAKLAAPGELGYTVHTAAAQDAIVISLVGRLLAPDGRVHTEISHEQRFSDPDSDLALVQANEKAAELHATAEQLNDQWAELRDQRLRELRAAYDDADAQAEAVHGPQQIVDDERD